MKVQRGKSVKILPTSEQEQLLWQFAGARRWAYNWALDRQMKAFENNEPFISANDLCKEVVQLKKNNSDLMWLNNISCDVPKQAIKDLDSAWKRYFKKQKESGYIPYSKKKLAKSIRTGKQLTVYDRAGHPKFKKKLNCQESFHTDCCQIKIKDDSIFLPKIGWVCLTKSNIFPIGCGRTDFKLYNPKVKFDGQNWYFVATVDVDINSESVPQTEPIGIDLGVKDLAILSDGTKYKNINKTKKVKKLEKRKRYLQRKISKKYEKNKKEKKYVKTKNIQKTEKQLLCINHKLKNIRKNYLHQTTSEIVKRKPIYIAMEDLNIRGMMKNRHLSKAIQNQGFSLFKTYISYKCAENNIPIYFVDRFYPSSKTCSCCGNIKKDLKLRDRIYRCSNCNLIIDRDINASINLKNKGQEFYNQSIIQAL
jgi:putative transposase